jgi:XisI protein
MEKISDYRTIARSIISELSFKKNKPGRPVRYQAISDNETGNYLLVRNGWKGTTRFYNILVHIEVTDEGTVWLHQDNTDLIIADMLLEAGIPQNKIVLAFHAPVARPDTAFAVG